MKNSSWFAQHKAEGKNRRRKSLVLGMGLGERGRGGFLVQEEVRKKESGEKEVPRMLLSPFTLLYRGTPFKIGGGKRSTLRTGTDS